MSNSIFKYTVGDRILCFHGPLLYEAKVLDSRVHLEENQYFVHYNGWKKNWDEWVNDSRMVRLDEAGLKKQRELIKHFKSGKKVKSLRKSELLNQVAPPPEAIEAIEQIENKKGLTSTESDSTDSKSVNKASVIGGSTSNARKGAPVKSSTTVSSAVVSHSAPKKTRISATVALQLSRQEQERSELLKKFHMSIVYPQNIKDWLIDDCDLVTQQCRLHKLHGSKTAENILRDYVSWSPKFRENEEPIQDLKEEFSNGMILYLNQLLGNRLLYKFERAQYSDILQNTSVERLSTVYGATHLLRLIAKLNEVIPFTNIDLPALDIMKYMMHDFLDYMNQNSSLLFKLEEYVLATSDYQRRVNC